MDKLKTYPQKKKAHSLPSFSGDTIVIVSEWEC